MTEVNNMMNVDNNGSGLIETTTPCVEMPYVIDEKLRPVLRRSKRTITKTGSYSKDFCIKTPKRRKTKNKKLPEEQIINDSIRKLNNKFSNILKPILDKKMEYKNKVIKRTTVKISNSEKCEVYVINPTKYLVTSSKGDTSYEVNPTVKNNNISYTCNCSKKHSGNYNTNCKHIYAVLFHNLKYTLSKDLSKPFDIKKSYNMKMYHLGKKMKHTGI